MDEKSSHTEQSESTQISSIPKGLPDQQQYYAPEPKEHRYDKIANRWKLFKESWRTIGLDRKIELSLAAAIFFAAAVSGSVAYFQWGAMVESNRINKRTMIAANRAWLAPITVELEDGFAQSGRLHFTVQFGNVGKEPAIDFVAQQEIGFIFRPTANQNLYDIFPEAKITDVCKGTQSSRGA